MADRACSRCAKEIVDRSIMIGDKQYHPDCFSCSGCKKPINGKFFPTPDGGFICVACGSVPCAECNLPILGPRLETGGVSYHAECFRCSVCKKEIKDKFSKYQGRIECVSCKTNRETEQKAKNDALRAAAAKDRAEREAKEKEERERGWREEAEAERNNVEARAKERMEQIRKEREERDRKRAEQEGRLKPAASSAGLSTSTSGEGDKPAAAAAPTAGSDKPASVPASGSALGSSASSEAKPAESKSNDKISESKSSDKPADAPVAAATAAAAPAAGVKRVAIKVGGGKVSISTSALGDEELAEINKLFAPLLRLTNFEKSSAGAIRKYDELKDELVKEVPAAVAALKALVSAATSLSGKDIIAALKSIAPQAERLVGLYKQYTTLSVSPAAAVTALRTALTKYFSTVTAANAVVTERASSASKDTVNNELPAAIAASETAVQALNECAPSVSSESGWSEYVSQLRAFAKEVEEQQLEAKEHTGAIMAARQADELIEAIPFVAHLSNQIMKRVADFGSPKLADEQKAEMALDGLALGDQLSKEAMPKLVKESILVALGTDSVDARNRMLMAAKKIAANLVELAKYAQGRFASKGAAPTEAEEEESEIISGGLKASMGILMDTATGLKEGRREIFARSPSPRHRRTPSGVGLGQGGSSSSLGSSDPTPTPSLGHRRTPSYAAMQKQGPLASSNPTARSQSPVVTEAKPAAEPPGPSGLSAAATASPTEAKSANVETKKGMTPSQIREEEKRRKEEEAKRIAALRSGKSAEFEKEKKEREEKEKRDKEAKEKEAKEAKEAKEKEAKEAKEREEKERKEKEEAKKKDDAERQRLLEEAKRAEMRLSQRDEEEEAIRKMEEDLKREEEALLAEENRVREEKAKAEEAEKAEKDKAAKAAADLAEAERLRLLKEKEDAELAAQRDLEIKRLAEIEEEEKRLREEEERLAKEEEEALRLAAEEERRAAQEKAPEEAAAAKSTGPRIEEALAECVVAQRAMEASPEQHAAINGLFNGLEMAPAAIEALTGAVKAKGAAMARLSDEDFGSLPDSVDRPRGPADYFRLEANSKSFYVVVSTGAPYLAYYAKDDGAAKRDLADADAKKAEEEAAAKAKAEEEAAAKAKAEEEAAAKAKAEEEKAAAAAAAEEASRKAAEAKKAEEDEAAAKAKTDAEAAGAAKAAEDEENRKAQEAADAEWQKAEEEEARQVEARASLLQREALLVSLAADSIANSLKTAGHTAHHTVLQHAIDRLKQMHKDIDALLGDYEKELRHSV